MKQVRVPDTEWFLCDISWDKMSREIMCWLREFPSNGKFSTDLSGTVVYFEREEDLLMFKLRWS